MAGDITSTHPPLPPTTEDIRLDWLRLLRSRRVGIATFNRLMRDHGSAAAALEALPDIAAAAGVTDYRPCPVDTARAELAAAARYGAVMLCRGEPDYPPLLNQIDDAPPFIWVRGDTEVLTRPSVAIVGARNASSLGLRMARKLARDLGEAGFCVVSGLARGVDAACHEGALHSGTIGVMAGGLDVLYPVENAQLAGQIDESEHGVRLSEQAFGLQPRAKHFPIRNRIVAATAQAVIVVEGAARSGSLITARYALDQGREVMAVPGHPFDGRASGCNMLIRDGATLVRGAGDVIDALERAFSQEEEMPIQQTLALDTAPSQPRDAETLQRQIVEKLGPSPVAEDDLTRDLAASTADVAPALVDLELTGIVLRQPGGMVSLRVG